MDIESDEDDFFGASTNSKDRAQGANVEVKMEDVDDGEEEGEEVEDEDDSDVCPSSMSSSSSKFV